MSVYSARTGLSSILKTYSSTEREKAKAVFSNKVRFEDSPKRSLVDAVNDVCEHNDWKSLNQYVEYLRNSDIDDKELTVIISEARSVVSQLNVKFTTLVESILTLPWTKRGQEAIHHYTDFCINIVVAHSNYASFCISQLIGRWIPSDSDETAWLNGVPNENLKNELTVVHKLLESLLTAIPVASNIALDIMEKKFPYYKRSQHVIAGYLHNMLWLMQYKPIFMEYVMQLIVQKLVMLDVNAPRCEIEENDEEVDSNDEEDDGNEEIFQIEDVNLNANDKSPMSHPIAHTLDICMEKLYEFMDNFNTSRTQCKDDANKSKTQAEATKFFNILLKIFDNVILPSHNTHHVQFLLFYFCATKQIYSETFLNSLLDKLKNPNVSAVIRQSAVGYIASYLARSKNISILILKYILKDLCDWAHQYIQRSDQYRTNVSLKANLVFFSVCQAVFYVIAFRSRDLTANKKNILFLESLQLTALVTCHLNPLRVCLPAVATAFAGVTRAYQLAYCHAILERNARRKLATVYSNETATAEETLDIFFPFDPYLLKFSGSHIEPHYLQYQASEDEEHEKLAKNECNASVRQRKRSDSEIMEDADEDEFLVAEKRLKHSDNERDLLFTYGLSPGFHI